MDNDILNMEWKVIDIPSGNVIANDFHGFCKCRLMTDNTDLIYVKDAEKDFKFIPPIIPSILEELKMLRKDCDDFRKLAFMYDEVNKLREKENEELKELRDSNRIMKEAINNHISECNELGGNLTFDEWLKSFKKS